MKSFSFFLISLLLCSLLFVVSGCADLKEYTVTGRSMKPTMYPGSKATVDLNYYTWRNVQRGDIVIYKLQSREEIYVKRIVGIPGDKVIFQGKHVMIGDRAVPGKATILEKQMQHYDYIIPKRMYLAIGDGETSIDSTEFGLIPQQYIMGRVVTIYQ